jgi:hypothetical protein
MIKEMVEAYSFIDFVTVLPLCVLKELNANDDLHIYADADDLHVYADAEDDS